MTECHVRWWHWFSVYIIIPRRRTRLRQFITSVAVETFESWPEWWASDWPTQSSVITQPQGHADRRRRMTRVKKARRQWWIFTCHSRLTLLSQFSNSRPEAAFALWGWRTSTDVPPLCLLLCFFFWQLHKRQSAAFLTGLCTNIMSSTLALKLRWHPINKMIIRYIEPEIQYTFLFHTTTWCGFVDG